MKKLLYFLIFILAASCSNQDNDFPDFDYKAVYFTLQYPIRTLVMGEDRIDNSLDKELKFHIGAGIGGMYKNTRNWTISYVVDTSLAQNLVNVELEAILALPSRYYTLSPENTIIIPSGTFKGLIQVQLTDAFLDDSLAHTGRYVIPLRMTGTDADSILTGLPLVDNPDKRVDADWSADLPPKDFVLFGIKYINPYHGFYLHRGKDVTYDAGNNVIQEVVYSEAIVEQNQVRELLTSGRNEVIAYGIGINSGPEYAMKLKFGANGSVVVDSVSTSLQKVYGTGKFVEKSEVWGAKLHDAIYLEYRYTLDGNTHVINDTLVFRNNGVRFQSNKVIVQ